MESSENYPPYAIRYKNLGLVPLIEADSRYIRIYYAKSPIINGRYNNNFGEVSTEEPFLVDANKNWILNEELNEYMDLEPMKWTPETKMDFFRAEDTMYVATWSFVEKDKDRVIASINKTLERLNSKGK